MKKNERLLDLHSSHGKVICTLGCISVQFQSPAQPATDPLILHLCQFKTLHRKFSLVSLLLSNLCFDSNWKFN